MKPPSFTQILVRGALGLGGLLLYQIHLCPAVWPGHRRDAKTSGLSDPPLNKTRPGRLTQLPRLISRRRGCLCYKMDMIIPSPWSFGGSRCKRWLQETHLRAVCRCKSGQSQGLGTGLGLCLGPVLLRWPSHWFFLPGEDGNPLLWHGLSLGRSCSLEGELTGQYMAETVLPAPSWYPGSGTSCSPHSHHNSEGWNGWNLNYVAQSSSSAGSRQIQVQKPVVTPGQEWGLGRQAHSGRQAVCWQPQLPPPRQTWVALMGGAGGEGGYQQGPDRPQSSFFFISLTRPSKPQPAGSLSLPHTSSQGKAWG